MELSAKQRWQRQTEKRAVMLGDAVQLCCDIICKKIYVRKIFISKIIKMEAENDGYSTMNIYKDISYTCGICETIFDNQDDLAYHPCFKNYNKYVIDDNFYCYPQCENGNVIRNSLMADGTEAVVMTNIPNVSQCNEPIMDFEAKKIAIEEQLIDEVFQRPALWNFKLPLTERSQQIKKKLWKEVFVALGGTLSIDTMKKKWKSLSDSFRIYLKKDQQAVSGSAARSGKKPWVHFQRMQFLYDVQLESKTVSNIELPEFYNSQDSLETASLYGSHNSSTESRCESRSDKRRKTEDPLDRVVNAMNLLLSLNVDQIETVLSRTQIADKSDISALFANFVAAQLRDVRPELRDAAMLNIFKLIIEVKTAKRSTI
ncbi:uncharacterized protein LOC116852584 [Odontomachus brunneus]|uniref:uncharacterized protein LOC116852584 n=1 Tax=Odontomachus brunneus TaxID=486640 RepID=UPI0013F293F0|nr:uncharacterized protein LOC116852584 [Odontomachus brunneus]